MSAASQAPATLPLKKGIVKQVSFKKITKVYFLVISKFHLHILMPTQQMKFDRNMFFPLKYFQFIVEFTISIVQT